ncbi:hypothetical protein [Ilumatobacter sp.]|uniref:hypothetical protein n=1 Tax=Ilumatobacter sp. TaxID=1967498 RepID=UPI003AF7DD28
MTDQFFPYRLDTRWKPMFAVLGVHGDDGVTVGDDGSLLATFGRKRVETTVENVTHTAVSGPHRWYTAVGLRLSFSDDGLTFGTNHERGLCIEFVERVPRVIGLKDHSSLWVSVADPDGLADAIAARR